MSAQSDMASLGGVAPFAGAWIEIEDKIKKLCEIVQQITRRTLRGCVD